MVTIISCYDRLAVQGSSSYQTVTFEKCLKVLLAINLMRALRVIILGVLSARKFEIVSSASESKATEG